MKETKAESYNSPPVFWRLYTLGKLELVGAPEPPLMVSHAAWSVLAYIAMDETGQPIARDLIQQAVFDEVNQSAHMVRNAIYILRKWLGAALVITRTHVSLAPWVDVSVDALLFLKETTVEATVTQRMRAFVRYTGQFLVKPQYGWAREMANHLHERHVSSLHSLLEMDASHGRSHWLLRYAYAYVKEREWDVHAHERYIQLLLDDGRQLHARQQIAIARRCIDMLPSDWIERMERVVDQSQYLTHLTPQHMSGERVAHFAQVPIPSRVALCDYMGMIWHRHLAGSPQFVVLRGESGSGKTQFLKEFQRIRTDIRSVWFGRSSGSANEDTVYQRLMAVISHNVSLRDEVMHIYDQLTPAQRNILSSSTTTNKLTGDAHLPYVQRNDALVSGFNRFISDKPLLVIVDDAPVGIINDVVKFVAHHPKMMVIVTSEQPVDVPGAVHIEMPQLDQTDIDMLLSFLFLSELPATFIRDVRTHMRTFFQLRSSLQQIVSNEQLVWHSGDGMWQYIGDAIPDTTMALALNSSTQLLVQLLAIVDSTIAIDAIVVHPWRSRRRMYQAIAELEAQHIVVRDEKYLRIAHAVIRQRIIAQMSREQRLYVHELALKSTSGIAQAEHALYIGDSAFAQKILHDVSDNAWRQGDVHLLRQAYQLMQQLPQSDPDVAWLIAVNGVRIGRFGAEPSEVRHAVMRLQQLSVQSSQRYYEALIGAGISLRWAGYPRESIDILVRVFDDTQRSKLSRIAFAAAHALTFAYIDCGEVSKSVHMLSMMYAPKTNLLSQVIIALTQSYVYARIGDFARADKAFRSISRYQKVLSVRSHALVEYHAGVISFAKLQHTQTQQQLQMVYNTMFEAGDMVTNLMAGAILCLDLVRFGRIVEAEHLVKTVIERATTLQLLRQRLMAVFGYLHILVHNHQWVDAKVLAEQCLDDAQAAGLLEYEAALAAFILRAAQVLDDRKQQALLRFHEVHGRMHDAHAFTWFHELAWYHLVEGNKPEALRWALIAESRAHLATTSGVLPVSIIAVVAMVLQQCHHRQYLTTRNRGVELLIMHLRDMSTPQGRADFVRNIRGLLDLVGIPSLTTGDIVVLLPANDAPRGRRLKQDELVPVIWSGAVLRNQRLTLTDKIQQLAEQAESQGATVMIRDLAKVLFVHERTILRAVAHAADNGIHIRTYRPRRSQA